MGGDRLERKHRWTFRDGNTDLYIDQDVDHEMKDISFFRTHQAVTYDLCISLYVITSTEKKKKKKKSVPALVLTA